MDTATTAIADPEQQFVGCLLWLDLDQARRVLAGMRATDLAQPMPAHVLQLVIEILAEGKNPAPAVVLAHARTTRHAGQWQQQRLGTWLLDAYGAADPAAEHVATWLKPALLEAAWRRALATHARRVLQAVEHSPTDVLAELADDTEHPNDLWRRYQNALPATTTRPTVLEEAA